MTFFPIFSYPSTIVCVDDDKLFLRAITRMLNQEFLLQTFHDPEESLNFFKNYKPILSSMPFFRGFSEHESYDTVAHMPVDLNIDMLARLRNHKERTQDISVLIVDYNMPNMNGLELCRKLQGLPIKKILLTGEVDHHEAVLAFNEGLIDRFVRKDNPKLIEEIQLHLKSLTQQYFIDSTLNLLAHLEVDHALPISDPVFNSFFKDWCDTHQIREHYLMDKQGNLVVVDHQNNVFYFIIHTDKALSNFVELHQDDEGVAELIESVAKRKLIPFFGIGKEPWQHEESAWPSHFYTPHLLEGKEKYFWTVIKGSA